MSDTSSPVPPVQQEPPAIEHTLLESFTEAVASLAVNVESFAVKVQEAEYNRELSRKRDRKVWIVGIGVIIVIALIAAVGVLRINVFSSSNRENIRVNQQNSDIIRDCVVPGGVCFQRNQNNLKTAVDRANDANGNGRVDTEEILQELSKVTKNQ
jgi:hypothetical protein